MAKPQSFCKMFFGDFSPNNMRIPCEFAKKHTALAIPPQICRLGTESARYSWIVKVEQMGDDLHVTDGWSEFVTDNDICATDFLVFRLVGGESMFEVQVYRSNGCLKEPLSPINPHHNNFNSNPTSSQTRGKDVGGPRGIKRLPVAFASKYGERLSKKSKVVAGSGETWNVKLEVVNGKYCFTRGWDLFVKDFKLGNLEYLVFACDVGKSEFHVSVYGACACETDLPTTNQLMEDEYDLESATGGHSYPRFTLCLKTHQITRLPLRKGFVQAAGLTNEYEVQLQYPPNEHCWPVKMDRVITTRHYIRFELRKGWNKFRRENGLVFGETYQVEYVPDKNVIQVRRRGN